ncbi:DUF6878 family protein [uncultured Sulfitobacter sp.]|uniref:DUF6878 family protein n=1 Tax=uncultured Sulfitobacter sp. TaxID=191468 RepID=UPI0030D70962|tara:strand:+ start:92390 stop:92866 length:477 start_codon:yes stop_codon:yes gene_type:complete
MTEPNTTPAPPFDFAAWEVERRAHEAAQTATRPANKSALFSVLSAAGIASVDVTFDGYGDSGQIESIDAKADETDVPLPEATVSLSIIGWRDTDPTERTMSIRDAIEQFAYDCLAQTHGGWENNEGAFGTFAFDVTDQSITLDYNQRFEDVESFEHAF